MEDLSRRQRPVVPLTDAATVLIDAAKGHVFTLSSAVARTLDGPTGGYDGQIIQIRCENTGASPITHTLDTTGTDSFLFPTGITALNPIPAGAVAGYVAQYHAGGARWHVLGDSLADIQGTATPPGGASGKVQYNDSGSFGGITYVATQNGHLKLLSNGDPASPTGDGGILLYSKEVAGRHLPKILGPSGIDTILQVGLHGNSVFLVAPANSTTAPTVMGGVLTTAATISHVHTIASSSPWQATRRTRFTTSTSAGNTSGMRTGYTQWFRGNAAGFGGFFFRCQLGANINLNGGQKFVGLCNSTAALGGDPSALVNMCGMGYDAGDSSGGNWFFMRNDGSGTATKTDLGATHAARGTTHGWDLIMFMAPNGSELFVRIVNLHTGGIALNTSYTTDLPAVNTGMAFKAEVRNGAVAAADNLEIAKVYIESDHY